MELHAQNRTILGKKVKRLRGEGFVPAELYGRGIENKHLSIPQKDFSKVYKEAGEHTIINLILEKGEKIPALISKVEKNSISRNFVSIDFRQVRMDEKIKTSIPIHFIGEAPAVKAGFLLVKVLDELEIEAPAGSIPHSFQIDLGKLERPGQSVHVKDVKMPKEVRVLVPLETVVVIITEQAKPDIGKAAQEAKAKTEAVETEAEEKQEEE